MKMMRTLTCNMHVNHDLLNPKPINMPANLQQQLSREIVTQTHKFCKCKYFKLKNALLSTASGDSIFTF